MKLLYCLALLSFSALLFSQNVDIPNAYFKAYLVGKDKYDINDDDEIQLSEALLIDTIDIESYDIDDLTGIEEFKNLIYLRCWGRYLTNLDLSKNTKLAYLTFTDSRLVTLNLANGNNHNLDLWYSPDYIHIETECIQVDNAEYSQANWMYWWDPSWNYFPEGVFSEDCGYAVVSTEERINLLVELSPNPASDYLTVSSSSEVLVKEVFLLDGSLVNKIESSDNVLFVGDLSAGMYMLKVTSLDGSTMTRFVKN